MTTQPTPQVLREAVQLTILPYILPKTSFVELADRILAALLPLLPPSASEREKELEAFVENISKQRPEKPDYWSSCGQCENNTDDAKELLAKSATPPVSEETR